MPQNYPSLKRLIEHRIVFGISFGRLEPKWKSFEIKPPLTYKNLSTSLAKSELKLKSPFSQLQTIGLCDVMIAGCCTVVNKITAVKVAVPMNYGESAL